mmetsp:Transcript_66788/g.145681  ORF Transcript_66788/g.145681 Transcript_66788/m.145681 type:complete len:308 (-) Transcript_66788:218-1141(-)
MANASCHPLGAASSCAVTAASTVLCSGSSLAPSTLGSDMVDDGRPATPRWRSWFSRGLTAVGGYFLECALRLVIGPTVPHDLLVFPDEQLPCWNHVRLRRCGRKNCSFAHKPTSLTRLLDEFRAARRSIDVCVFNITLKEIAECLMDCHRSGIQVRIITDMEQLCSRGSDVARIAQLGIKARHDNSNDLMHHKFTVVDGRTVLTGSFNYTRSAVLQNREHILILRSWRIARGYRTIFEDLWEKYEGNDIRIGDVEEGLVCPTRELPLVPAARRWEGRSAARWEGHVATDGTRARSRSRSRSPRRDAR